MNFLRFWPRPKGQASSKERPLNKDLLAADLFAQLTYMSVVSAAGVGRSQVFEYAAKLPYSASRYFRDVYFFAQRLHYDYAQACRVVGDRAQEPEIKSLLLRFSGSLSAGESEADFLEREAQAQAESYGNKYERDIETLKKWADAYVALVVAGVIVVIVAVISMLIYSVGTMFLLFLVGSVTFVTILGTWVIYRSAPHEVKTHSVPGGSTEQLRARALLKPLIPLGIGACLFLLLTGASAAWVLIVAGLFALPVGLIMRQDDGKIDLRDQDIPAVVRALGGVTSAVGSTVTDALSKIDQRSMGHLTPDIQRLYTRLTAGIAPDLCWQRFVSESGSEMVSRTVRMFWDGIKLGGDPERIGLLSSLFAMRVSLLRAKRKLVSSTFNWLVIPLHVALIGLLVFIQQLMNIFQTTLANVSMGDTVTSAASALPVTAFSGFNEADSSLFFWLVMGVVILLTVTNAFAPKAADGGHGLKLLFNLGIMVTISGVNLLVVPRLINAVFSNIAVS